jgi:Uma2 family endonuclease
VAVHVDPALPVHPLSLDAYHRMIHTGILDEDDRVELLEGVLVEMSPNSPVHAGVVQALTELLLPAALAIGLTVRVQLPLTLAASEPEPDLAVISRDTETMRTHPSTALLVVEVAVTSHALDRGRKASLYAAAGIGEYWVIDVPGRAIEVSSVPVAGRYAAVDRFIPDAVVVPITLPSAEVDVGALLAGG